MTRKRLIMGGIALVVISALLLAYYLRNRGDEGIMKFSGNVEATEANVGFKIPGRVKELLVDEGYKVKQGDVLARLDGAELASVVDQARAALQEATTRLAELKAGSRPQEIERARANRKSQEAELTRARKDYERAEVLFKNGAISASQHDAARSVYENRAGLYESATESLSLVREGPRREDIEAARQRVEQAQAALRTSEERFNDTVIYAPFDGVILRKYVELGETVAAGTPVFDVGDLKNPWIKVYVKEPSLTLVKLGQKARIAVDSYPKKTYEGVVTYISSEAEFTPKQVQTDEERVKLVFGVKVRVNNKEGDLKPSMPADVTISLR